jgi:hypothetical protein
MGMMMSGSSETRTAFAGDAFPIHNMTYFDGSVKDSAAASPEHRIAGQT